MHKFNKKGETKCVIINNEYSPENRMSIKHCNLKPVLAHFEDYLTYATIGIFWSNIYRKVVAIKVLNADYGHNPSKSQESGSLSLKNVINPHPYQKDNKYKS